MEKLTDQTWLSKGLAKPKGLYTYWYSSACYAERKMHLTFYCFFYWSA